MMKHRKYVSGTRWALWRWTTVDSEYLTRLHILKTPFFAICLHWINKPDPEPWLHDHPVSFLSIILRGSYAETRKRIGKPAWLLFHRWFNWVKADPRDQHTIHWVAPHTLTLCLMGPKTREWGFHTRRGWVHWKDYYAKQRAERGKEVYFALKEQHTRELAKIGG